MSHQKRPPVITIMGHVDHGKTTLLDYLRQSKIAAKESGGITQHIGAYQIDFKGRPITFIDTPGHAAFHKMRERGAKITDIVILVVAANDGVKPQTLEAIRHIKEAKVPVVVAINKIDLPDVRPEVAKSQLAEHDILISEYGGDVEAVEISALTGKNIDSLLETLLVVADLLDLSSDPDAPLKATVIEASKSIQQGALSSVIVQQGTLRVRQDIQSGEATGRIKRLVSDVGETLESVGPGFPAQIIGFTDVPAVGAVVFDQLHGNPESQDSEVVATPMVAPSLEQLLQETPKIKLIIKADVEGTLEAITQTLDQDSTLLLEASVGDISDKEVELAKTSGALILAFRVGIPGRLKKIAKENGVRIKKYDVIYHLIEDLQKQMMKLIEPSIDEIPLGEAEILQVFEMKGDRIAGCRVKTGEIKKTDKYHLKRDGKVIMDPVLKSMMRGKEEITSCKAKSECGLTFRRGAKDFQVGDILVAYKLEDDE